MSQLRDTSGEKNHSHFTFRQRSSSRLAFELGTSRLPRRQYSTSGSSGELQISFFLLLLLAWLGQALSQWQKTIIVGRLFKAQNPVHQHYGTKNWWLSRQFKMST